MAEDGCDEVRARTCSKGASPHKKEVKYVPLYIIIVRQYE